MVRANSKVFLATTANEEFWDREKQIVFLHEGCKLYSRKNIWENLDHKTFSFCLDTADKIKPGLAIYYEVLDKFLNEITRILNQYHGINKEVKYYQIILEAWARGFISQLYEKYITLREFSNSFPEFNACLLSKDQRYIPLDYDDYDKKRYTDEYSLQIYSEILELLGFQFQYRKLNKPLAKQSTLEVNCRMSHRIISFVSSLHRRINRALGRKSFVITHPYCSKKKIISFILKSRFKYVLDEFRYPVQIPTKFDMLARDSFRISLGDSEFEHLLSKLLFKHLPFIFLEGFKGMRSKAGLLKISKGDICYTSVGLCGNLLYSFFLAENYQDITLLIHQHGGGYSFWSDCLSEKAERAVADRFYTWGSEGEKCRFLPHPKVSGPWENSNRNGEMVLVMTMEPRYMTRLMYCATGASFVKKHIDPLFNFLDNIRDDINISIRPHPNDNFGWEIINRLMDRYRGRDLKILSGDWESAICNAKIMIHSVVHDTTFLETLARNIPTISYFDPDLHRVAKTAQKHFDNLIQAEIIHRSPQQAAEKLNETFNEPEIWWRKPFVQEVRAKFVKQFARGSDDWQADWRKEFDEVLERGNVQ